MANQGNGWTRERPTGVDAMRDYQPTDLPAGARVREYYKVNEGVGIHRDGEWGYSDSWWHPVRADGRYPALPVEDDRKWVPTRGHTLTGAGWNCYFNKGNRPFIDLHSDLREAAYVNYEFDYVLPYRDGDTRDTLPPLPSDGITQPGDVSADSLGITATPKPLPDGWSHGVPAATPSDGWPATLTPEEELTVQAPPWPAFEGDPRDCAFKTPAPEPSRLEIAARFAVAIMHSPDRQLATAKAELIAHWAIEQTDALIAAARKERTGG